MRKGSAVAGIVFQFPGQGSQKVGMGADLFASVPGARELFEEADAILGVPLSRLCFEGPEAELTRTENTQPALFLVSMAALRALEQAGIRPAAVAGHSLGEYSALAAAGALSFADGLRVVRRRGELMAEVGDRTPGAMAAILGLGPDAVRDVCVEAAAGQVVEPANYNSPEQTVISGEVEAVERAMALAKERGASRAIRLNVSAPFHCSLMAPLGERMAEVLAATPIETPQVPVVANVTAEYVRTPEEIREALVRQVSGAVRWTESIQRLAADGYDTFVEAGSGRVLTGLAPRIAAGVKAYAAEDTKRVAALQEALAG